MADFDVRVPFRSDVGRRAFARAEIDALFMQACGAARGSLEYILDAFQIVKRKDEAEFGEYRTECLIPGQFDAMAETQAVGRGYDPIFDPPAADSSLPHPKSTRAAGATPLTKTGES